MSYTARIVQKPATMIDPHIRNQMSLMAWVMTLLCGWVMFLSAYLCVYSCNPARDAAKRGEKITVLTVNR